jgi:uncharacterized membrane protein (DUF485 family)
MKHNDRTATAVGSIALGAALTAILAAGFFLFVSLGSFAPSILAAPISDTSTTTLSFVFGLGLIAAAVALTSIYVIWANVTAGPAPRGGR